MKKYYYCLYIVILLVSCQDDNHGISSNFDVETRFQASMEYASTHPTDTIIVDDDSYMVYVGSDSHLVGSSHNLTTFVQLYRSDNLCPVAIHLGDHVRGKTNLPLDADTYSSIPANPTKRDTIFSTIGNHDLMYGQWTEYFRIWKTSVYWFVVSTPTYHDVFICLDNASGTLGRSQILWLNKLLAAFAEDPTIRHRIVYSHVDFFRMDNMNNNCANMPQEETYELIHMFEQYHVAQYWSGHDHCQEKVQIGNVVYIAVDALDDKLPEAGYMAVRMSDDIHNDFRRIN